MVNWLYYLVTLSMEELYTLILFTLWPYNLFWLSVEEKDICYF